MITRLRRFHHVAFHLVYRGWVITGLHVYTLMFAGFGIPFNPLELVSLLGSVCLLMAACLSLFKPLCCRAAGFGGRARDVVFLWAGHCESRAGTPP